MKKYFICILLIFITSVFNVNAKKNNKLELTSEDMEIINNSTLQKIIEINLSKDELFNNTISWIEKYFVSKESLAIKKDKDAGLITGIGDVVLTIEYNREMYSINYTFKYIFECKDNKIRFTLKDIYFYQKNYAPEAPVTEIKQFISGEDNLKQFSKWITNNNILKDIKEGIEKKNDNW